MLVQDIPFALQISIVPEETSGCPVDFRSCKIDIHAIHSVHKGFASMELARAYMDVFTASFNEHPEAEFSSTMSIYCEYS
ncbi:hypothetical protein EQU24_08625 [Methylotuvimicrobium buryatense]|uniref:Uncharacterized protein n=1 Tax=Methylotuvimicrobium buryatense TaxID=95641 RepID=A0A4P9UY29_METBY|nr:hypothetical protein EQU24_08625 [Methylotuvimicrobium buryatense]